MSIERIAVASILTILLVGILAVLATSCKKKEDTAREVKESLIYFKDQRTGLCFAFMQKGILDAAVGGLASVPCDAIRGIETNMPLRTN